MPLYPLCRRRGPLASPIRRRGLFPKSVTQAPPPNDKEGVRRFHEPTDARPGETRPAHPAGRRRRGACRLPAQVVELTAERLRVIAEPNRIALLEALNEGEGSVQELADRIGAPHQKVSKHLVVLYGAGMVARRRGEGATVLYALTDWTGWWVVEQIGRWVQSGLGEGSREEEAGAGG